MDIAIAASKDEREAAYALRHVVFVEEQGVPVELEIDEHDETDAIHYLGRVNGDLVATARIRLLEERGGRCLKIQRVAVDRNQRGQGLGHLILKRMIADASEMGDVRSVVLDAQTDALRFYEALGFDAVGPIFDDAGIPHRHMVLKFNGQTES